MIIWEKRISQPLNVLDTAMLTFLPNNAPTAAFTWPDHREERINSAHVVYHLPHVVLGNIGTATLQKVSKDTTQLIFAVHRATTEEALRWVERTNLYLSDVACELQFRALCRQGVDAWEARTQILMWYHNLFTPDKLDEIERQLQQWQAEPLGVRTLRAFTFYELSYLKSHEARAYAQAAPLSYFPDTDDPADAQEVQFIDLAWSDLSEAETELRGQQDQWMERVIHAYLEYLRQHNIWGEETHSADTPVKRTVPKKGMHEDTRRKLRDVANLRRERIVGRQVRMGKTQACKHLRVEHRTVRGNAPELWDRWDDPDYQSEWEK